MKMDKPIYVSQDGKVMQAKIVNALLGTHESVYRLEVIESNDDQSGQNVLLDALRKENEVLKDEVNKQRNRHSSAVGLNQSMLSEIVRLQKQIEILHAKLRYVSKALR